MLRLDPGLLVFLGSLALKKNKIEALVDTVRSKG
jgi:hypothetical protein